MVITKEIGWGNPGLRNGWQLYLRVWEPVTLQGLHAVVLTLLHPEYSLRKLSGNYSSPTSEGRIEDKSREILNVRGK